MKYLSLCSGIEAATVAWHPLGWEAIAYAEVENFPSHVLAHHYPQTQNHGDMTNFKEWPDADVDLLVGGTPCQSFSVAGLRKGLADPRGNLMLTYLAIADRYRPRWLVWENVPGVLSSDKGRDFGTFLGGLGQLGYGFAYRILDAQYVRVESHSRAVPQRRRRVFVVGHLGDWRRAAAVLFERESLCGNIAPSRKAWSSVAARTANGVGTCGADDNQGQAGHLIPYANAGYFGTMKNVEVGDSLRAKGGDTGNGGECLVCLPSTQYGEIAGSLTARHDSSPCADRGMNVISVHGTQDPDIAHGHSHPLGRNNGSENAVLQQFQLVRRLTPTECERLQGFPDGYTDIPTSKGRAADGPRYKALGNSMAVNCMRWIGDRIQSVEEIPNDKTCLKTAVTA